MNRDIVIKLLLEVLDEYYDVQDIKYKATEKTNLFGGDSVIDSMGLVNVVIDIETRFLDEDIDISLTSEKAMSLRNSPFRTVETLATFIMGQIGVADG